MQRKQFKLSLDYVLIGTALVVLCAALYLLFSDGRLTNPAQYEHLTPVGKFAGSKGDVRRRVNQGIPWNQIRTSDKVYEGDNVSTGEGSTVEIELEGGGKLELAPNSLVVVTTKKNEVEISLKYGSLQGQVADDRKIVLLDDSGQRQQISGKNSELKITKSKKSSETQVEVLKGQVAIENKSGDKKIVKQNEAANIGKEIKQVKIEKVDLAFPKENQNLWATDGDSIEFSWNPLTSSKRDLRFEISKDSDFKSSIVSHVTGASSATFTYSRKYRGRLYWRVGAEDSANNLRIQSEVRAFNIWPNIPPVAKTPLAESTIEIKSDDPQKSAAFFAWQDNANSASYQLQIARDIEFKNLIETPEQLSRPEARIEKMPSGKYFWRVRGLHPERSQSPWTDAIAFQVLGEDRILEAPQIKNPELAFGFNEKLLQRIPLKAQRAGSRVRLKNIPAFQWGKVAGAKTYRVETSPTPNFEKAESQVTKEQVAKAKAVRPGPVYWRVYAQSAADRESPPSSVGKLNTTIAAPKAKPTKAIERRYTDSDQMKKDQIPVPLEWTEQGYARQYELEWSLDESFRIKKALVVDGNKKILPISNARTYAWRVRGLDENRNPISEFSKPSTVKISKILEERKLAAIPPTPPPQPDAPPQPGSDPGTPGLAIPKPREPLANTQVVAFGDTPALMNFNWKMTPGVSNYRLQISRTPDFSDIILNTTITASNHVVDSRLPAGRLFWRVRSEYPGQNSLWSNTQTFSIDYKK